jgi:hypothetical protein
MQTKQQLKKDIASVHTSERNVKAKLGSLSRSLLEHVIVHNDITLVNSLIVDLTPMNQKTCTLYFKHFLPFHFNEATGLFEKLNKKQKEKKRALITEFLTNTDNNVWTWYTANVTIEKKEFDAQKYAKTVANRIAKEGLSPEEFFELMISMLPTEVKKAA